MATVNFFSLVFWWLGLCVCF